jgi:hypothetical protein
VVWANGVLASLAVGLLVQLVCPWHDAPQITACCEFDGNRHRVETNRLDLAAELRCSHFRGDELGDLFFRRAKIGNVGAASNDRGKTATMSGIEAPTPQWIV